MIYPGSMSICTYLRTSLIGQHAKGFMIYDQDLIKNVWRHSLWLDLDLNPNFLSSLSNRNLVGESKTTNFQNVIIIRQVFFPDFVIISSIVLSCNCDK